MNSPVNKRHVEILHFSCVINLNLKTLFQADQYYPRLTTFRVSLRKLLWLSLSSCSSSRREKKNDNVFFQGNYFLKWLVPELVCPIAWGNEKKRCEIYWKQKHFSLVFILSLSYTFLPWNSCKGFCFYISFLYWSHLMKGKWRNSPVNCKNSLLWLRASMTLEWLESRA